MENQNANKNETPKKVWVSFTPDSVEATKIKQVLAISGESAGILNNKIYMLGLAAYIKTPEFQKKLELVRKFQ